MKWSISAVLAGFVLIGVTNLVRADDANAVLDRAIKAMGGEEKLGKAKAVSWKMKGKFSFDANEGSIEGDVTLQGIDHYKQDSEVDVGGNQFHVVTVLAGDKGWRKFNDNTMELDKKALANDKQLAYMSAVDTTLVPLKGKGFKIESAGEAKVGDKPADKLKVTGPDGKEFTLYFDKQTSLLVRQVAKVADFRGEEYTQDTTYSDYKEMGGIKKATKMESKRDGEKMMSMRISDFKILDKVDPKTFVEP